MSRAWLLLCLFLAPGVSLGEAGDAHLYGGGDPTDEKLASGRERLRQSFGLLKAGMDVAQLCTADACAAAYDSALCQAVRSLTPPQAEKCRSFLLGRLDQLERAADPSRSPFRLTDETLRVPDAGGALRPVAAMTKHAAEEGPITWHRETVRGLPLETVVALFVHELGHRVGLDDATRVIRDEAALPPFQTGRQFLDAIGAAMALYAMEHSVPRQSPPAFPPGIELAEACGAARDTVDRFLLGVGLDAEKLVLPAAELAGWRAMLPSLAKASGEPLLAAFVQARLGSPAARALEVRRLFRQLLLRAPTPDETRLMVERLSAGVPYEAIVASVMGDDEYATKRRALGPQQFVVSVYADLHGRAPTYQEIRAYVSRMEGLDRPSAVLQMMRAGREPWERWVNAWYKDYLNRIPTATEAEEQMKRLRGGAGWEAVRASLLSRPEYVALQALRWERCPKPARGIASQASFPFVQGVPAFRQ